MIQLKIGDHVEIEGVEFEVWSMMVVTSAQAKTGKVELADPLVASRWRAQEAAKKEQEAVWGGGMVTRALEGI